MCRMSYETGETLVKKNTTGWRFELSPSEREAAVATPDSIIIVDGVSLDVKQTLPTGCIDCISYSPDSEWLAACGGAVLRLYLTGQYVQVSMKQLHQQRIRAVAFAPSSSKLATGSQDRSVIVWCVPDLSVVCTMTGHTGWVCAVLFLSENVLATGGEDKTIRVWDAATGNLATVIDKKHQNIILTLALSPDGSTFASDGNGNVVKIFCSFTFACIRSIQTPYVVRRLCYAEDDVLLIGVDHSGIIMARISSGCAINHTTEVYRLPRSLAVTGMSKLGCAH